MEEKAGIKGEGGGMASIRLCLWSWWRRREHHGSVDYERPCIQAGTRGLIFRPRSQGRVSIGRRHGSSDFPWIILVAGSEVSEPRHQTTGTGTQGRPGDEVCREPLPPHCKGGCELFACTTSHAPSSSQLSLRYMCGLLPAAPER